MGDSTELRLTTRFTALDGLRGLAALIVVIHHCLLVSRELAAAVHTDGQGELEPWVWWTTFTPLHLLWAGQEAVYLFFILSGFVLMLPFLGDGVSGWASYYSKRLIRIYLPVWASLIFAMLLACITPRVASPSLSSWVNLHDQVPDLLRDMLLLGGVSSLNSPLWSLQWEMLFSLLLPLYLIVAIRVRSCWLLSIAGLLVVIALGNILYTSLPVFMPMFGIGALMAVGRHDLDRWGRHLGGCGWVFMFVAAVPLLCARWMYPQLPVVIALATVGGALVLFAFTAWRPTIRLGNRRVLRWLGLRSFSLYLVHEPIILSVTYTFRSSDPVLVGLFALPLSLATAEIFFRLVERPSHRLAGVVGRALGKRPNRGERAAFQDHRADMF